MQELLLWQQDGGAVTLEQFQKLELDERYDLLEYLEEFSLYEEVEAGGKSFVLVHAGLDNFSEERELSDYSLHELIFKPADLERVYFKDRYLVTGHLPTLAEKGNEGTVMIRNNNISIDCGKVFGGRLAAVCLDDLKEFDV